MTSDDNTSDIVFLPNNFKTLVLPEPLIEFFDKFGIKYKITGFFPMEFLRSLYKTDYKFFKKVLFFLSLYGCNFHSIKGNSFFPRDVNDIEDVLIFSGPIDSRFSIADMSKYEIWDFCKDAYSSKCILLSGIIVSRLQKESKNTLSKLIKNPLFSVVRKRIYRFEEQNKQEVLGFEEPIHNFSKDSLTSLKVVNEIKDSAIDADCYGKCACVHESTNDDSELPLSSEFFEIQENEIKENKNVLEYEPINSAIGICAPCFWIRFVASFFSMDKRAKKAYLNMGYRTYGELANFKKEHIKIIVDDMSGFINDSYLIGIYENELISFCKSRDSFLSYFDEIHPLKDFMSPSDFVLDCIRRYPNYFYYFDSNISHFMSLPLEITSQNMAQISDFAASYLRMFGVIDLSFVGDGLLTHSISDYGLQAENECISYFVRPIYLVDSLLCSLMERAPSVVFGIDHEVYSLWVRDFIKLFYQNIGKFGNEAHKKHLEILNLRETTELTLEALGEKYGVTRERIRQIEAKTAKALKIPALHLMNSLFQIQNFLPLCFVRSIPGLYSCIKEKETKYYVDQDLSLVLREKDIPFIEKMKGIVFESDVFQDLDHLDNLYCQNGFSLYGWLNKISYHLQYDPYPEFILQKTSLKEIGQKYLLLKGTAGYDVNKDEKELTEFYRTNAPFVKNFSYRAITSNVLRGGAVLRGMSVYISSELINEQQKIIVRRILDEEYFGPYGLTGFYLFEKHKEELLLSGIDNAYFLYGIASADNYKDYQFGGRSLRISRSIGNISLPEMAEQYIRDNGPVVKVDDFCHNLHLKIPALQQISNLTKFDSDTLVLKTWFEWTKDEFVKLELFIDEKINHQGFCHAYDIIESAIYFDDDRNGFLKVNRIGNSPSRLVYFLDAMAERYEITKYHFSHHCDCISFSDKPIETKIDMATCNFKGRVFTKKDVKTFFKKFHLSSGINNLDFYSNWTYFLDNDGLVLKEDLQISDETIKGASDILSEYYGDELYITSITAINRLNCKGYKEQFDGNSMEMASVLSESDCSDWCIPENDIGATSSFFRTILVNKKTVGKETKYSSLIRLYILKKHFGKYLSISCIQKELKEQALIDNHVSIQMLNDIFSEWFSGPVVEVPDES